MDDDLRTKLLLTVRLARSTRHTALELPFWPDSILPKIGIIDDILLA
jgi:hypothetical protein